MADVEVEIRFLSTAEGGKDRPCRSGYRPPFCYDGRCGDAFYDFDTDGWIYPGDTVRATVEFVRWDLHAEHLHPGKDFELREGSHRVATGRVLKILR